MKNIQSLFLLFATVFFIVINLQGQDNLEDVVYLKNGNIYRGLIIEQIPAESIKIRTIGGNVFTVMIADIQKLTKEEKFQLNSPAPAFGSNPKFQPHQQMLADTAVRYYRKDWDRKRGYLLQANFILDFLQFGIRVVNGYKINRYAQIGLGLGIDGVVGAPQTLFSGRGDFSDYMGPYLPMYLYFGGEVLKRRVTPYYAIEAGYAFAPRNLNGSLFFGNEDVHGGPMGSVGFGGRVNVRKHLNLTFLFNINVKNIKYFYSYYDEQNQYFIERSKRETFFFPGFRFGIGF